MPTTPAPPPLRLDPGCSVAELLTWREAIARSLSDLRSFAGRGAARRAGVLDLRATSATAVTARVEGSARLPYTVELERVDGQYVGGTCTCPYSDGLADCKHVWAALDRLQAALARAAGGQQPGAAPPRATSPARTATCGLDDVSALFDAAASGAAAPAAAGAERQVEWHVRFDAAWPVVEAFERHRGPRGTWKPARKVSLEQLEVLARWHDAPGDVGAVGRLIELEGPIYSRRRRLDGRLALEALEGSPDVVRADAPARRLTVRRAEVGLGLRTLADGLRVDVTLGGLAPAHEPDPSRGVLVARDDARDLVLVGRVPRRAIGLVRHLLQRALQVPWSEGPAVLVRLAQLERVLPLSLPEGVAAGAVEADARPRLVLEPRAGDGPPDAAAAQGLRAALRVRPLDRGGAAADAGPALLPGQEPGELLCVAGQGLARARRDLAREEARAGELVAALDLAARPLAGPWTWELDLEASLALLERLQAAPPADLVVEWPRGEGLRLSRELDLSSFRVVVRSMRDWFELDGDVEVDGERIELAVLLNALRQGERHVALAGGRFLRLTAALRARLEALRGAARPRQGKLELDATAAPVVSEALEGVDHARLCKAWRDVVDRLDASRSVSVRVPRRLRAELRDYQRDGWAWLKRLSTFGAGACLADDMGLGKTVQTIAALIDRAALGPALVVAPTSVGPNWARELARFAPSLRATLLRDTARDAQAVEDLGPGDVLIASYDLARLDVEHLATRTWATLVLDEAQRVKNARTKTADALAGLDAQWRLALTGTPVENRLSDLWSLFRIVSPGLLGSWESFRARFAAPIERDRDPAQAAALARLLRPYVLRRTKEQVLSELPPRTETVVEVTLGKGERALYEDARLEAAARLQDLIEDDAGPEARFHVLAALTRLRQLACHPRLVEGAWQGSSAKLDALLELARELVAAGHRALVFSQFTAHLALVREALELAGVTYHYLDGATPAPERQRAIDAFQSGDRPLFLISLKAGGVGLNLTGADYVVHLDPWWNPAVEDQATGRAHRIGQSRPVTVYRLVARDTVEERILALHASKRELVTAVLEGSDRAGALSTEELVALIRGADGPAPARARAPAAEPPPPPPPRPANVTRVDFAPPPPPAALSGDALRALRKRLGLSQRQLGELVGASQTTVCHWETLVRAPGADAAVRLARLAARPPAELLAGSGRARRRRATGR